APGAEARRVRPAVFADYFFTTTLAELLSAATAVVIIGPLFCAMLSGLAIGTAELNSNASVIEPFRHIARVGRDTKIVAALLLVFIAAFFVAFINIVAAFRLGFWLASGTGWFDAQRWSPFFSFEN